LFSVAAGLIIGETWRSSRSQSKQRSGVNDSIEELQIRVRELNERLRTWEASASEERQRCVTSHHTCPCQLQERHQELARIIDRVVEIGLRGGTWAELQNDTPLQSLRIQSDLPMSSLAPYVNAERTHTEPDNTITNSDDT
jgi:optic atrophy 3 protein